MKQNTVDLKFIVKGGCYLKTRFSWLYHNASSVVVSKTDVVVESTESCF